MTVKIESGLWKMAWQAKKASTAFADDVLVAMDSGYAKPADSGSGGVDEPIVGLYCGEVITAATTGTFLYSNTAKIPIMLPVGNDSKLRMTATGTLAVTDEGLGLDISDSVTVNAAANTYKAVTCTDYISATEGLFVINKTFNTNVAA